LGLIEPLAPISGPLTGIHKADEIIRGVQHFGHIYEGSKKVSGKKEH